MHYYLAIQFIFLNAFWNFSLIALGSNQPFSKEEHEHNVHEQNVSVATVDGAVHMDSYGGLLANENKARCIKYTKHFITIIRMLLFFFPSLYQTHNHSLASVFIQTVH